MGTNRIQKRLNIDSQINKGIQNLMKRGTEYLREPLIEFTDFSDEKELINYLLKLGLIKFSELEKK